MTPEQAQTIVRQLAGELQGQADDLQTAAELSAAVAAAAIVDASIAASIADGSAMYAGAYWAAIDADATSAESDAALAVASAAAAAISAAGAVAAADVAATNATAAARSAELAAERCGAMAGGAEATFTNGVATVQTCSVARTIQALAVGQGFEAKVSFGCYGSGTDSVIFGIRLGGVDLDLASAPHDLATDAHPCSSTKTIQLVLTVLCTAADVITHAIQYAVGTTYTDRSAGINQGVSVPVSADFAIEPSALFLTADGTSHAKCHFLSISRL